MSKLGRYAANRIKCQSVTGAYSVTQADCGTQFSLDLAAGFTLTLPTVAQAGAGWWCRVVVGTNCTSNNYLISAQSAAMRGGIAELEVDTSDDNPSTVAHTTITMANALDTVGDWFEFHCDGTYWYVSGQTKLDGGAAFS